MKTDDFNLPDDDLESNEPEVIINPPKIVPLTDAERKKKKLRLEELLEKKRMREEYFDELSCNEFI